MRLRSIELGGYKSFGNRTLLRFDAGLTAVVGPNGSGKSNIMDALRWVIGEGANRSLRVRRLDDVIFTGSAERAPAGLAEVRLRLDNEDRWLGLDAAEVEVQRRVHRDGESEFRLNGRAVRLREIQELFHNSGLGAGGYALMGQGLVDEVLRLRPQERRRLIEEVADLRRHRRKMLESRRQRERAEQHLERARLLRGEIEPRLRALERQARRAKRREELETELNAALRAWYAAAAAQLADEERRRQNAAQTAQQAQQQAEEERAAAAAAAAAAERAVDAARSASESAAAERRAAQARLNDLQHALELDQRRRDWLTSEAANLAAELGIAAPDDEPAPDLESAAAALAAAETALREARDQRDRAQQERDEHAHRRAVAEALRQRLEDERVELERESQTLNAALAAQQETLAALETAHAEAATTESDAAQALQAARDDEAKAAEALEQIDAAQTELRAARAAIEREIGDLTARITALDDFSAPAAANAAAQLADEERRRQNAAQTAQQAQQQAEEERAAAAAAAAAAERAVDAARSASESAAAERRAAQARLNDLQHALELDQRRRDWLTSEAANLAAELGIAAPDDEPAPDLESAAAALAAAETALREARDQRDRAQQERDEHAHRRAVAEALRQRLEDERVELERESQTLNAALAAQQETLAALETAHAEAATTESDAAQALQAARDDEAKAAEALEQIDAAQTELRAARAAIEREIGDLTARITALDDFSAPAAANGAAPQLLGRLRIQTGYELAIEAALGAAAEAEVQPTAAAALKRARDALRRDEQSWIGVAADLAAGRGQRRSTAPAHPNGAGSGRTAVAVGLTALDVIDAPSDLRPIVDALLSGVRIVDDIEQAQALLAETEQAIATRDGILLRADGVVATRSGQSAARARQQQRLTEWREQRSAKRRELRRHPRPDDDQRAQAAQERDAAAALVRQRAESHTAAGAALSNADRALQAARAERERLDDGAQGVRSRLERVHADLDAASAPIAAPPAAEPPPEQDDLTVLEQERDAAAALHADARARAEQIERRSQAAARLRDVREEINSLCLTLAEREQAVAEAETAAADNEAPTAARSALDAAEQERAACRRRLETAQAERLAAERAAVEAQAALRETRAAAQRLAASAEEDQIDLAQLPPAVALVDADQLRADANALRDRLNRLGAAPPDAAEQHEAELERFTSLHDQIGDLEATEARLREAERELETLIGSGFRGAFEKVDAAFQRYFRLMFRGGRAQLTLTQEQPPADADSPSADSQLELEGVRAEPEPPPAGVEIIAQPPGKRVGSLDQLSGGERALTAIALLFALLEVRPVPFCVLDEVDAALDEANVERFVQALKERAADMQFVVITHNRRTIEQADAIYGVTMASDGLSKVLSVRLDNLPAAYA